MAANLRRHLFDLSYWHVPPGVLKTVAQAVCRSFAAVRTSFPVEAAIAASGRALGWLEPRNFLLLGTVRSGTTLMMDYLNCHRKIHCRGEILGHAGDWYGNPWRMSREHLKRHVESYFVKHPGILRGAKILTFHVDELPLKLYDIVDLLARPRIVLVYREQLLEQFVSLKIAERDGLWHGTQTRTKQPIAIDPTEFIGFARRERQMWSDCLSMVAGCETCILSYEELVRDAQTAMRKVFTFLGEKPCAVQSKLVKINPEPLAAKLANYPELLKAGALAEAVMRLPFQDDARSLLAA